MIELLHIISDENVGGAGRSLLSFLDGFDTEGFRVRVAVPQNSALIPLLAPLCAEVIPLPCAGDRSLSKDFFAASARVIRDVRPTILHTHAGLAAQLAAICHRVPVRVATKHRVDAHTPVLRRWLLPNAGIRWIAVSQAVARGLRRAGVDRRWVYTVPNGVAVPTAEETSRNLRKEFGIGCADPVFAMVGRCEKEKGVQAFLQAAHLMEDAVPNAHFLIVGDGALLPSVRAQAGRNVHVTGYREDMDAVYATVDVLINHSFTEAASMSILEAMAAGLPVIATRVGGTPELITEACGRLIAPGDVGALVEGMLAFLDTPYRLRAGARSKERAKELYENKVTARILRELYLDFCGESSYSPLRHLSCAHDASRRL